MIDPLRDELLSTKQVARLLRRKPGTVWLWMVSGHRGVPLEHVRIGVQYYTTEAAIRDFLEAIHPQPRPVPNPAGERRAGEAAYRRLQKQGLVP